jgi:hypothetical protein
LREKIVVRYNNYRKGNGYWNMHLPDFSDTVMVARWLKGLPKPDFTLTFAKDE